MASALFPSYQQLIAFPQMRTKGSGPSRPGVYGSINCRLRTGSRPTSLHPIQPSKPISACSTQQTRLRPPQKHNCSRQVNGMARRATLVLLVLFLFQPPACEATPPVFNVDVLYRVLHIPAETKPGSVVYRIQATDSNQVIADNPISFRLTGRGASFFSLETIGETQVNLILERSLTLGEKYELTIRATDNAGESVSHSTRINATEAPSTPTLVFVRYPEAPITIPENAPRGFIASVEVRKNAEENRYPVVSLTGSKKFQIKLSHLTRNVAIHNITLVEPLDYEKESSYLLKISAVGGYKDIEADSRNIAVVPLTILVGNIPDTAPVFEKPPILTKIPVNKKQGEKVFTIRAKEGDKNSPARIRYEIQGEFKSYFNVDTAGQVTVAAPLNRLLVNCQDSPIVLEVKAEESNGQRPTAATSEVVILIQNPPDSTLNFATATFRATVDENVPYNTPLKFEPEPQLISEAGCGIIKLEINTISDQLVASDIFEVRPNVVLTSGPFEVFVKNPAQLDYEKVQRISFEITATNLRMPGAPASKATIIVSINDQNDNAPVFTQERYFATIPENAHENAIITQVTATDLDNGEFGKVYYTSVRGEGPLEGNLAINRDTGQITLTTANHGLDREVQKSHIITVEARDNQAGSGGKVNIAETKVEVNLRDANDNAPVFSRAAFSFCIPLDLKKNTVFWTARAADIDEPGTENSKLTYTLTRTNNYFSLSKNGDLSLTQAASTIPEQPATELAIQASDGGTPQLKSKEVPIRINWDKRTCKTHTVEYLLDQHPLTVENNRGRFERMLTDLNSGALTKIDKVQDMNNVNMEEKPQRYTIEGSNETSNDARTKVTASVIQQGNVLMDLSALNRLKQEDPPIPAAPVETYSGGGGVSDAWKWVLIALLILLALVLLLLLCCCLLKPAKKKTNNSSSQRSQVVEVATIGANRHRHHHHHHRQPPPEERVSSAPSDRRAANGRGAVYSRYMQDDGQRPRKSLDGTEGDDVMVDPATGKRYRVRYENGRRILVRSGEGERPGKKVTRGTNVTENSLQPEAVETNNTPPLTVVEGDDDQKQLLKNQFLEKKSLFTIAYDGMHSKHDLLKDIDEIAPPNAS